MISKCRDSPIVSVSGSRLTSQVSIYAWYLPYLCRVVFSLVYIHVKPQNLGPWIPELDSKFHIAWVKSIKCKSINWYHKHLTNKPLNIQRQMSTQIINCQRKLLQPNDCLKEKEFTESTTNHSKAILSALSQMLDCFNALAFSYLRSKLMLTDSLILNYWSANCIRRIYAFEEKSA